MSDEELDAERSLVDARRKDKFTQAAATLFGVPVEKVTADQRLFAQETLTKAAYGGAGRKTEFIAGEIDSYQKCLEACLVVKHGQVYYRGDGKKDYVEMPPAARAVARATLQKMGKMPVRDCVADRRQASDHSQCDAEMACGKPDCEFPMTSAESPCPVLTGLVVDLDEAIGDAMHEFFRDIGAAEEQQIAGRKLVVTVQFLDDGSAYSTEFETP